jgi:O-acetyl-ADP-ribose deacetylase (regulator of RNase III)
MPVTVVEGDLLEQNVDCIVNAWNRNLFPWWLLLPQGVSGAIKRRAGLAPFKELRRYGMLPLGAAVITGPGRLPIKGIIHVAGIGLTWRASEASVRLSVRNAVEVAQTQGYQSLAFPLIGAGTGALKPARVEQLMLEELSTLDFDADVRVVRFACSR